MSLRSVEVKTFEDLCLEVMWAKYLGKEAFIIVPENVLELVGK